MATSENNGKQTQIAIIIILFLSSFTAPFILLFPIQELLYRPHEYYLFETIFKAYIILMFVLIAMAIILLINLLITPTTKKGRNVQRTIVGTSWLLVLAILFLCINHYQIIDEKGLHTNNFFSLQEDSTSWAEIVKVEQTNVQKDGVTKPDKLIFTLNDGTTIEQSLTAKLVIAKAFINYELSKNGITIENVYSENE
jgi:amino acid transporter